MTKPIGGVPKPKPIEAPELFPPLPDDIPKAVWALWPRRLEAHTAYNVTRRVVATRVQRGLLKAYTCPDATVRIPTEQLDALLGDPSKLPARDRSTRAPRAELTDADLELDDPVVGMFRECRMMLRDEREHGRLMLQSERDHGRLLLSEALSQNAAQLKLLVDPVGAATKLLQEMANRSGERVESLETRQDAVMAEREAMADFRHVRDVEIEQVRAREARRAGLMKLLEKEIGPLLLSKIAGGSLADFVAGVSPELVDMLIESGMLSAAQTDRLRSLVTEQRARAAAAAAKRAASESNGAPAPQTKETAS